jgi:heat shock protein 90kDa beta
MLAIVEHVWEAEADDNSYVIKEQTYPEKVLTRGTQTTLYLRVRNLKDFL